MSTILVVDDDAEIRESLRTFVEDEGHRALEAADASSARRAMAREPVDLIFLDALMPGESGTALCHSLKDDPESGKIKVVLLTSYNDERAWNQGLRSGADILAVKPVTREKVRVLLHELLASGGTRS